MVGSGSNAPHLEAIFVLRIFDGRYEYTVINALMQELFFCNDMTSHSCLR